MNRIMIYLSDLEREALVALATRERRGARDQASLLVRRGLEHAGLLEDVAQRGPAAASVLAVYRAALLSEVLA